MAATNVPAAATRRDIETETLFLDLQAARLVLSAALTGVWWLADARCSSRRGLLVRAEAQVQAGNHFVQTGIGQWMQASRIGRTVELDE